MKTKNKTYVRWIIYLIALAVFILEIIRIIVLAKGLSGANEIRYAESILVAVAAVLIRLTLNPEKISSLIKETDIEQDTFKKELKTSRFINLMPIAFRICKTMKI